MQGSICSPMLFNCYLEAALYDNVVLKRSIDKGCLMAFADDILIRAKDVEEAEEIIGAFRQL